MKILLFGKGGQVGWELQRSLSTLGELTALDFDSTDFHANFSRPAALGRSSSSRPQTACTMSRLGISFQPPTL